MSQPANRWKLGLFVVMAMGLAVAAVLIVGGVGMRSDVVRLRAYFGESVTGLQGGAAVKLRGVSVGEVASLGIAPDNRHVEVAFDIEHGVARQLGWVGGEPEDSPRPSLPPDLRAQLASRGVTGVMYLQLDFFDPEAHPVESLSFEVPAGTVPTTPSTLASLEESLLRAVEAAPRITERTLETLEQLQALLSELQRQQVPTKMANALGDVGTAVRTLNTKLDALPVRELSSDARETAAQLRATLAALERVGARLEGDDGLVASLQRTSDSIGTIAGRAHGIRYDVGTTLRDLQHLIETLQSFVDALERDPDMLLKGRAELR